MRTFIAIKLPIQVQSSLSLLQNQLKNSKAPVRWVKPENIHLTLKFLGEVTEEKIEMIMQIMKDITSDKAAFHVHIGTLGAFPKINRPRVLWVGIDKGNQEIKEIAEQLENKIVALGIPKEEKPFSSHITLGRLKSSLNCQGLIQKLSELKCADLQFLVSKITLYKSTLTPQGPIYEIVDEANLRAI